MLCKSFSDFISSKISHVNTQAFPTRYVYMPGYQNVFHPLGKTTQIPEVGRRLPKLIHGGNIGKSPRKNHRRVRLKSHGFRFSFAFSFFH